MNRYFLLLFIPVILLSCNTESVRKNVYGNITVVTTTTERERILAAGRQFIGLKTQLYYKDQKFDFTELAESLLKTENKTAGNISLLEIYPSILHPKTLFYCKWTSNDGMAVSYLKDNGSKLTLIPLLKETVKAPLPILEEIGTLDKKEVMYANYIIDEQEQKIKTSLPVISNYYKTANEDSTNYDSYANTLYGVSPDQKIIVRSCSPSMMSSYPELARFFLTEKSTGKTTEFKLLKDRKRLVEIFNEHLDHEETPKHWFNQNFEWVPDNQHYNLRIKDKNPAGKVSSKN